MSTHKDVAKDKEPEEKDLYAQLDEELAKGKEEEDPGASAEPLEKDEKPEKEIVAENGELSEEEISKLSPRAQKRIRELAQQVKDLAEKPAEQSPEKPAEEKDKPEPNFKNVKEFLEAVQDEPSRKLLETFYNVIRAEQADTLGPIEKQNAERKFDETFAVYEKIPGLSDLKDDLKKTFMRDPSQPIKPLIADAVADLEVSRVKPIEGDPSEVNRGAKPDINSMDKDELYDLLGTLKE
jgi:hypothetical protein